MKKTLILFALACAIPFGIMAQQSEGIQFFEGSYKEALAKAKEENKVLFVDAYASWCGPCKLMSKHTFTDAKVGSYFNEHFVSLKIDMEKGEGPSLSGPFGITAYPTLLFINSEGKILKKELGYHQPKQLIEAASSTI